MALYVRILSPSEKVPDRSSVSFLLQVARFEGTVTYEDGGDEHAWTQMVFTHADGTPIAWIDVDPVKPGSLAALEIQGFCDQIAHAKPWRSARWLADYLRKVRMIYAVRIMDGAYGNLGRQAVNAITKGIHLHVGGILQVD